MSRHPFTFYVILLLLVNDAHQTVQYAKLSGRRLDYTAGIIATSTVAHYLLCATQCSETDGCDSFNVNHGGTAAAAAAVTVATSCELLQTPAGTAGLELVSTNAEWDLYTSRSLFTTGKQNSLTGGSTSEV